LNVITLTVPPLRERPEDILLLSEYFLDVKSPVRAPKSLSDGAKQALTSYKFPGNIRELEHLIERAIIFSEQNLIHADALFLPQSAAVPGISRGIADTSGANDGILTVDELEKKHIAMALNLNNWEQQKTARQLGISTKTLYNKIKKYDLRQRND
jgi:DNA-binding NtrC family response regulator